METARINAALAEMNNINQSLIQRCVNLALELSELNTKLANSNTELEAAKKEIETLKSNI